MRSQSALSCKLSLVVALALFARGVGALAAEPAEPASAAGLRQIASTHLLLHTDLPAGAEIDALPGYFDQAFQQWCDYFGVDAPKHADWRVEACLMKTPERFRSAGLWPADLPPFRSGITRGERIWLLEQPNAYYRRHLLLHEGTHAFMYALVGSACSPWYFEGVAELLATHRLADGKLELNCFPRSRDEVPKLGRIEMVQRSCAAGRPLSLEAIFAYDTRAHFQNEPYAWCWAAAAFLDGHPRYRERFRQLSRLADRDDFAARANRLFAPDAVRLAEDWQLFAGNLDYGYDFERIDFEPAEGRPLADAGQRATVAADRGWQSSGVRVEAGQKYRLAASGRYQVAQGGGSDRSWPCEPGGVTIRYYRGRPLGILLAAVRDDAAPAGQPSGLLDPTVVGLRTTFEAPRSGTLYFRINDSAGSLSDNAGTARVKISRP